MSQPKKVCWQCGYFNKAMGAKRYKCAMKGKCPGIDWSEARKQRALKNRG
jgi:hypothetical protein